MFGRFIYSFREKLAFGAPSEGGGNGGNDGGSSNGTVIDGVTYYPGDTLPGGSVYLGSITLGGGGNIDGGDNGGGGNTTQPDPEPTVEVVDILHVETAIISNSYSHSISGPITLVVADEYITDNYEEISSNFTTHNATLSSLGLSNFSIEQLIEFHNFFSVEGGDTDGAAALPTLYELSVSVPIEHLLMVREVENGQTLEDAFQTANSLSDDEFVFTDSDGNYGEADFINNGGILVSSGIDVTNGLIIIEPSTDRLPDFAIPIQGGMGAYSPDSIFYHDYDASVGVPLNGYDALRFSDDGLAALEAELIANPTPGDDIAASINGSRNDVGNLPGFDGGDNFVFSSIVDNPDPNQSDIVVNYTDGENHMLSQGYVGRMIQRYDNTPDDLADEDYSYSLVTFGEGDDALQGSAFFLADIAAQLAWLENSYEIFDAANDSLL